MAPGWTRYRADGALDLFHQAVVCRRHSAAPPASRPGPAAIPPGPDRRRAGGTSGLDPADGTPARPAFFQGDHGRHEAGAEERLVVALGQAGGQGRLGLGAGAGLAAGRGAVPAAARQRAPRCASGRAWRRDVAGPRPPSPVTGESPGRRRAGAAPGCRDWPGSMRACSWGRPNRSRGWRMKYWSSGLSRAMSTDRAARVPRPGPAGLLPQAGDGARIADQQRGVQVADVDAQLQRRGGGHAQQPAAGAQAALDLAPLLGPVAGAVGAHPVAARPAGASSSRMRRA